MYQTDKHITQIISKYGKQREQVNLQSTRQGLKGYHSGDGSSVSGGKAGTFNTPRLDIRAT